MSEIFTINSRKIDNSIHRTWECKFLEESHDYWLFVGKFDTEIQHPELGIIRRGTISYEYFHKTSWFNIFRFHEPNGELKFYYCNISIPPQINTNVVNFIDLDIDILVQNDFSYTILDNDEFEQNSKIFAYSDELKLNVNNGMDELIRLITNKQFPFSQL